MSVELGGAVLLTLYRFGCEDSYRSGLMLVAGTLLQSQGRVKASLFLQSSGSVLCLFPVLLALWLVCGLDGVWYAPFAAALLSAALTAVCFLRFRRM